MYNYKDDLMKLWTGSHKELIKRYYYSCGAYHTMAMYFDSPHKGGLFGLIPAALRYCGAGLNDTNTFSHK
jgi:hypothetical protein